MTGDNTLHLPDRLRDAIDEDARRALQSECHLDCHVARHGKPADDPDQLRARLHEAQLFADVENPFFRDWLMRRLSETHD